MAGIKLSQTAIQSLTVLPSGPYLPNLPGTGSGFPVAATPTPAGIATGAKWDFGGQVWDIRNFGAKGDCRWITDAGIASGGPTFTSTAQAQFTQADVGKRVDINGAVAPGANGNVLVTTILSVQSATSCTLAANATVTVTAGTGSADIGTENVTIIQAAINKQQTLGGTVYVPRDSYGGKYLSDPSLIPAPGSAGAFTTATRPLLISGDGMANSYIVSGGPTAFSGIFGQTNVIQAQVVMSDLTLDGNYLNVGGGALPQPASSAGALLALPWPYQNAFAPASPAVPTGQYHDFLRVRFYRPSGFTFQPSQGVRLTDCVFDQVGQPDVAFGGLHWDNLGSGPGDVIAIGCSWLNSAGNYADFTSVGVGTISRLIMTGCTSVNHLVGGVYALGVGSVIYGNRLSNVHGSAIAYDSSTPVGNRSKNMVFGNVLDNIAVNSVVGPASFLLYGDLVFGNQSTDAGLAAAGITFTDGPLDLVQTGGNFNSPASGGATLAGDKIILGGIHDGFGWQTGALVAFLQNAAGHKFSIRVDPGGTAAASSGTEVGYFDANGRLANAWILYPGPEAGGATQALGGLVHSTGVPNNANANNNDRAFSDNGHTYFKAGAVWSDNRLRTVQTPTEAVLVSGIDMNLGEVVKPAALTAARLVGAPLNPVSGQRVTFTIVQDGSGGRAVTWNAVFKVSWLDTGNTLNKRSSISFLYDGTNWNQDGAQAPYV